MKTASIGQMVQKLAGLIGTKDVSDWEDEFLSGIEAATDGGKRTSHLTEKQLDVIVRLHSKHFA